MNYGEALEFLQRGARVARDGWNGKGLWVCRVTNWSGDFGGNLPADWSAVPFLAIKNVDGGMVPWTASQTDALADDWCEAAAAPEPVAAPSGSAADLDPRAALDCARQMKAYCESFNGRDWSSVMLDGSVDAQNLAVALDNLLECSAMLMNMAARVGAGSEPAAEAQHSLDIPLPRPVTIRVATIARLDTLVAVAQRWHDELHAASPVQALQVSPEIQSLLGRAAGTIRQLLIGFTGSADSVLRDLDAAMASSTEGR